MQRREPILSIDIAPVSVIYTLKLNDDFKL